ncbi:putative mitochondrial HIRA-interacting protein 5, putative (HIRIP5) [Leptomonas pyrrhocoris]|uniref:Putative mitochondrial HIRA-interacting protein 5, putative (HIRIP5) n=1 Tax=Leptomonas pyrrhocoris TaxID=157538 RepID=A0A0M9GBE0_LEPPY|nr:putative mitochondrial HIRA-interacting protein 5, putative (HIRIP5) [Leptomonas pyrrhocoris]XP_015665158.1 putative mitochondrial HIRA-interacting protein 5, putative (HIRIP5) [Leptomonas pyrrhocoris]KPA86718.1 putative mitochondrial HIRA-interacting protein 5, putative (HIRIP5) [Leptomonas pyrrhocoris]KPA86719.1 putative mitochondrial HIRA-interacting protein 5, putative (HIRIP5) [Leptomonas pyrrhocoris]|eukprot:XP_015665157.1 putative mitochondrial HIRA-interacting protein 5, putative (HIRIP5) [Leptomonas pyrrhocoris]
MWKRTGRCLAAALASRPLRAPSSALRTVAPLFTGISGSFRRSLSNSVAMMSTAAASPLSSHVASGVATARRTIVVETSETPNPDCLRFFSMDLSFLKPEFSVDIPSPAQAYKSPLAEALFGVAGVQAIFIADEYVTVRRHPQADWAVLIPTIKEVIIEFAESKESVLSEAGEAELAGYNDDTEPEDDDDEVVLAVKELLATRIRPMLRADGGNVRFIDMDDGTVFLLLQGACKACPSSHITLKSGIERMLMHWIPEVVEAQEVSDEVAADIMAEKRLRKSMKEKGEVVTAK